jgi:hypothetical protein
VHGRQAFGSESVAREQLPISLVVEPIQTVFPERAGSSQQPKQSQPSGVNGKQ